MTIRIGQGFDAHRFSEEQSEQAAVVLGGVSVPSTRTLLAHSDGDVLLHALTDALLGALALGDIGKHFPDSDPNYKGADSRQLLKAAYALVQEGGYKLINADATIVAQAPKMAPYIDEMRKNIAADLSLDLGAISVKATTTEKMGFTGRGEGIAVQAVVLVESS